MGKNQRALKEKGKEKSKCEVQGVLITQYVHGHKTSNE
jgi:hypothetical protein